MPGTWHGAPRLASASPGEDREEEKIAPTTAVVRVMEGMRHVEMHPFAAPDHRTLSLGALVGFIALTFLAVAPAIWIDARWYAELHKPAWAPPGAVFGPVWTLLYVLIGIAGWGVWKVKGWGRELGIWLLQLVLNAAWTPIFFGLRQPGWALVEIAVLWLCVALTMAAFAKAERWAAWLLAPYLLWVSFATALNLAIWQSNRI